MVIQTIFACEKLYYFSFFRMHEKSFLNASISGDSDTRELWYLFEGKDIRDGVLVEVYGSGKDDEVSDLIIVHMTSIGDNSELVILMTAPYVVHEDGVAKHIVGGASVK